MTKFSLIVPTLGRTTELSNLLLTLQAQTFSDFEVIIVDQNVTSLIDPILEKFSDSLSIVHLKLTERGASHARNKGIDIAKGEILTFPDDDCEYQYNYLEKINAIFETNSEYCGISTPSTEKNGSKGITRFSRKAGEVTKLNIFPRMVEFSIFIRKSKLADIRFNENLGPGSKKGFWCDEGPDLVLRLMKTGCKFYYTPNIQVFHPGPWQPLTKKVLEKAFNYGRARGKYLRFHKYPFWYVLYVWGKYFAGWIWFLLINFDRSRYYFSGLRGRISGYFSKEKI